MVSRERTVLVVVELERGEATALANDIVPIEGEDWRCDSDRKVHDALRAALARKDEPWKGWQHAPAIIDGRTKPCVYADGDIREGGRPGPWRLPVLVIPLEEP